MQPLVAYVHHSTQGGAIHPHMSRYPQTVYYSDTAGLQHFIQCIAHSQEGWETRRIISKVALPHFPVLQWWWVTSIDCYCNMPCYATSERPSCHYLAKLKNQQHTESLQRSVICLDIMLRLLNIQ